MLAGLVFMVLMMLFILGAVVVEGGFVGEDDCFGTVGTEGGGTGDFRNG